MLDEIIDIVVKLIAAAGIVVLAWGAKKLKSYLEVKAQGTESDLTDSLIYQFVCAAEQQLKADDPTGSKRLNYVLTLLSEAGVVITEAVRAKIEAAVYEINLDAPKEAAQTE